MSTTSYLERPLMPSLRIPRLFRCVCIRVCTLPDEYGNPRVLPETRTYISVVLGAHLTRREAGGQEGPVTGGQGVAGSNPVSPTEIRKAVSMRTLPFVVKSPVVEQALVAELVETPGLCLVHGDHDVGSLDHGVGLAADDELKFIHCLVGDRCRHHGPLDLDADVRGGRAFCDFHDGAFEPVAGADLH